MSTKPNPQPNFTQQSNLGFSVLTTANTSSEGGGTIGTTLILAFTPGANDSYVDFARWMPTSSSAANSTQATIGRIFISSVNTGSPTSSNTYLIDEVVLPSVSADSSTVANNPIDRPLNFRLNGSNNSNGALYLLASNHNTPAASSQWVLTVFGSDY
jgi:hypothetical protein